MKYNSDNKSSPGKLIFILISPNMKSDIIKRQVKPKIGLLPTGHFYYWDQFPELKQMGINMYNKPGIQ